MTGRSIGRVGWLAVACIAVLAGAACASYIQEEFQGTPQQRTPIIHPRPAPLPSPSQHVPELARYLDRLELRRPLVCGRLAVFPVVRGGSVLGGNWLTMDTALARGVLVVTEKESGSVPIVWVENRSRSDYVLLMAGEVVSGGKQTRTFRQDAILAPGQRLEVGVFCVEAHRWSGGGGFQSSGVLMPQSIQQQMRRGADQAQVWSEVARSNAALGAQSPTGSIEAGLNAPAVRRELDGVRRLIVPECPREATGYIFVDRYGSRGIGAEFFGRPDLAAAMLPKLIDAYAVDLVVQTGSDRATGIAMPDDAARNFLDRIRRAGSYRDGTPGSGVGITMRAAGLVGSGVGFGNDMVHFGCQVEDRILPPPVPMPMPYLRNGPAPGGND